jgi:putative hemolysin
MRERSHLMRTTKTLIGSLAVLLVLLPACSEGDDESDTGLPNPASVYCEEQGGTIDVREDADGNQYGICIFDDGSECDEWAFFRGECAPGGSEPAGIANPASVYCEEQGGTIDMRTNDAGAYGVCVFDDGSECDEWAFFRGECDRDG